MRQAAALDRPAERTWNGPLSRSGQSRRTRKRHREGGLAWILPALIVSVGITYYCVGYTGYISTLRWNGVSPLKVVVGFQNYITIFAHDPVFRKTLEHTAVFFVVVFTVQVVLGILFAALLHSKVRLAALYKVVIFIPVVIAPATMAPTFREILAPAGQFNSILHAVGLGFLEQPWLASPRTALSAIIAISIWQSTGVAFILYFAAMSQIDTEVIEAARLDGAGNFRLLTSIVWPSVRGTTVALSILNAIGALKTFDIPYLVAGGGPDYATEFLGTYIYRVVVPQSQVGYGASLSILLLILAVAISVILSLRGRRARA